MRTESFKGVPRWIFGSAFALSLLALVTAIIPYFVIFGKEPTLPRN